MNTAFPNACKTFNARSRAGPVMLALATALTACQSPPPGLMAPPAVQVSAPTAAMPAPQAPFDTTPITPVESAGAAAQ